MQQTSSSQQKIIPVILSGGAGTRLWPLSRRLRPKQFLPLVSETSLFAETLARVSDSMFGAPVAVCNEDHRFLVAEEFLKAGIEAGSILLEPAARNTAPAITAAALHIARDDPDAVMLVLPSDHVVSDTDRFRFAVSQAAAAARQGLLVAFGVQPTKPETGYGYIEAGEGLDGLEGCRRIARFVEKPDRATAETYVASENFLWNSGMFVFSARTFLDELERFHPEILTACRVAVEAGEKDLSFCRLGRESFAASPAISIDYAVMEKTENAAVVEAGFGWSDVGAWSSLAELGHADGDGNVTAGDVVTHQATGSYIRSEGPLIAAVGTHDLLIVASDDAVVVAPKDRAQDVRHAVLKIESEGRDEHHTHTRVYRPWGHYQNLQEGPGFLVKQIMVKPGAKLSLQYHDHRAEHWVVVAGTARVTNGDETLTLQSNESTYIPVGVPHRLENPGDEPLRLIEVQSGSYIGEDDIVRLGDDYGRD